MNEKLIQYLGEAYGKEKELEVALEAHIAMAAGRPAYQRRLEEHLKETQDQATGLRDRIDQLGGLPGPPLVTQVASTALAAANMAVSAAKGPVHMLRGTSVAEKLVKNAKTELWNEYEEIGNYLAIEALAEAAGDEETAKLARTYRRQEERMAGFLEKQIPVLTRAVANESGIAAAA